GALDTNFDLGLWVTDGTSAGTWELAVGPVDSNGHNDPSPVQLTSFGSEVLFSSWGNLWVTDGTSPGTSEISVTGANTLLGLAPNSFFKFGSEMFFRGRDSTGVPFPFGLEQLWVTDGTSAGTSEISVVNENPSVGLDPSDFAALGSEVLFVGRST